MKKSIAALLLLAVHHLAEAQIPKDTLFFLNGSIVIGKIKSIRVGIVTFDPDDANDITVQLPKLRTIAATRTVFRVETTNEDVYFGQLRPSNKRQTCLVFAGTDTVEIAMEDISNLYAFKNSFWQRFTGNAGLGFTYTRSSGFGQLNFNGNLTYQAKKEEITFSASGIYTITDSSFTRDREDFSLRYNHYFSPSWFATGQLSYQRNLELGLERRFQQGGGVGNKFITTHHVYAWARTGLVLNQEKNTEGETTGTLSELFGQVEFNFFKFSKPQVNALLSENFYYSLSQAGRIRNDSEFDLFWEIIKDLKLDINFYYSFDSQPPGGSNAKFDFGAVFGLTYTFFR
jgi:hypothetical protein